MKYPLHIRESEHQQSSIVTTHILTYMAILPRTIHLSPFVNRAPLSYRKSLNYSPAFFSDRMEILSLIVSN